MKKYIVHLLRKNLVPLAVFTLFCIVVFAVPVLATNYYDWNGHWNNYLPSMHIGTYIAALGALCVIIPIWIFSYKMNRRSIDLHYSLPLSHTKVLVAHFLVGLILLYSAYTISCFVGFLVLILKVRRLHLVYYFYMYLSLILPAFIVYSTTAFLFTRANTMRDGIFTVIGGHLLLPMVMYTVAALFSAYEPYPYEVTGSWFFAFTPFVRISRRTYVDAIETGVLVPWAEYYGSSASELKNALFLTGGLIWAALSVAATVGLIFTEKYSRAENCGQVSSSIFSYKLQLPVYSVLLMAAALSGISSGEADAILAVLIAFVIFLLSLLYKRTIKFGWKYAVVIAACLIGGILVAVIAGEYLISPV